MKLLTYQTQNSEARLGFIHNNKVIDMENFGNIMQFPLPSTMLGLIDMGDIVIPEINALMINCDPNDLLGISFTMDEITILAPIPTPRIKKHRPRPLPQPLQKPVPTAPCPATSFVQAPAAPPPATTGAWTVPRT